MGSHLSDRSPCSFGDALLVLVAMTLKELFLKQGASWFPELQFEFIQVGSAEAIVFFNPGSLHENKKYAYFGFWKVSSQKQEQQDLFSAMASWGQARGAKSLIGPLDISTFFSYRLRLEPDQRQAFMGEPQNTNAEIQILRENHFAPVQMYETLTFSDFKEIKKELGKISILATESLEAAGLRLAKLKSEELESLSSELYRVTESIFSENSFYLKIPEQVFHLFFIDTLKQMMDFEFSYLLKNSKDELVGYSLLLRDPADPSHLMVKSVGVEKPYRQMGLSFLALVNAGLQPCLNYSKVSFCLMKEGNFPSLISRKLTGTKTQYALFGKSLS